MQEGGKTAEFRFYEELNDMLPPERRGRSFVYAFCGGPAIKDVIEAIGVPHTEVDLIEFLRCEACGRVYWKGSHFARMEAELRKLTTLGTDS